MQHLPSSGHAIPPLDFVGEEYTPRRRLLLTNSLLFQTKLGSQLVPQRRARVRELRRRAGNDLHALAEEALLHLALLFTKLQQV